MRIWLVMLGAMLGLLACGDSRQEAAPEALADTHDSGSPECLGSVGLCARTYDEVSYFTSHNAMSNEEEGWFVPNHYIPVSAQLELGVRALMLDIHIEAGDLMLCHGACIAGSEPLVPHLEGLRRFLEDNPTELLTLILESYAPASDVAEAFEAAGLDALAHAQSPDEPWPTVGALIESGGRLVVLSDEAQGGPAWMHDVWAHAFETHFSVTFAEDLTCETNRGDVESPLFIFNHFLSTPFADAGGAEAINEREFVLSRALECWEAHGTRPHFITVDFTSLGDVAGAVDALNQLESPKDRSERPARRR